MLKTCNVRTFLTTAPILVLIVSGHAQKKDFTAEQLFKTTMPAVVVPLPTIVSWDDDNHLVLSRKILPDSIAKQFLFDPETGREMPLEKPGNITEPTMGKSVYFKGNDLYFKQNGNAEIRLTSDSAKEVNPTFSPDSNYVAYTKNNNLYFVDISSRLEKQITFDGMWV